MQTKNEKRNARCVQRGCDMRTQKSSSTFVEFLLFSCELRQRAVRQTELRTFLRQLLLHDVRIVAVAAENRVSKPAKLALQQSLSRRDVISAVRVLWLAPVRVYSDSTNTCKTPLVALSMYMY